jgi:hypothetical protein
MILQGKKMKRVLRRREYRRILLKDKVDNPLKPC